MNFKNTLLPSLAFLLIIPNSSCSSGSQHAEKNEPSRNEVSSDKDISSEDTDNSASDTYNTQSTLVSSGDSTDENTIESERETAVSTKPSPSFEPIDWRDETSKKDVNDNDDTDVNQTGENNEEVLHY
jgi:hypothetical protein